MATRYIGDARITVRYDGYSPPRMYYSGRITVPVRVYDAVGNSVSIGKVSWDFTQVGLSEYSYRGAADAPEAFDQAAAAAVAFGAYFTTHNRGDDLPEWAPSADVADAIEDATSYATDEEGRGLHAVRRSKNGPIHWTS